MWSLNLQLSGYLVQTIEIFEQLGHLTFFKAA